MAPRLDVALEIGPKGRKVAAVAARWPGLERGATTREGAIEALERYVARYAAVAAIAGLGSSFGPFTRVHVVEEYEGPGSTDFWGISFGFSRHDEATVSPRDLARELALLRACWTCFDTARHRVSVELRKGPRGGGRDRDRIVEHVLAVERDWAKKVGVPPPDPAARPDRALTAYRDAYVEAIRAYHAQRRRARTWPLRYLIRHSAYHSMDHTWEMEDRDLSRDAPRPS